MIQNDLSLILTYNNNHKIYNIYQWNLLNNENFIMNYRTPPNVVTKTKVLIMYNIEISMFK